MLEHLDWFHCFMGIDYWLSHNWVFFQVEKFAEVYPIVLTMIVVMVGQYSLIEQSVNLPYG